MSSNKVIIKRRPNFSRIPEDVYANSKRAVGACYTQGGEVAKGITQEEMLRWMPEVLNMSVTDNRFYDEVREFFNSLSVEVPIAGVELEVGTLENGEPINKMDYIKYKFVLANPKTAPDEDTMKKSLKYQYFIYDPKRKLHEDSAALALRKEAYKTFLVLSTEKDKMDMVMVNLGINIKNKSQDVKEIELEKFCNEHPADFLKTASDPKLKTKSFILNCLDAGILRRAGSAILNGDDTLGLDMDEAVAKLDSKANSDTLSALKARLSAFKPE